MKKLLFLSFLVFTLFIPNLYATELYGKVESVTLGSEIPSDSGKEVDVKYHDITLNWEQKNRDLGKNYDGWWIGLKIYAPDGYNEEKATIKRGGEVKAFSSVKEADTNYLEAWFLVTQDKLEALKSEVDSEGYAVVATYEFDWDGSGENQTLKVKVVPDKITLGNIPEGFHMVTFESDSGKKYFSVENDKSLEEYLSEEEKELLNKFIKAPEGKELVGLYLEDGGLEFNLSDKISADTTVKVIYKVTEKDNPNTGNKLIPYVAMALISLITMLGLVIYVKVSK